MENWIQFVIFVIAVIGLFIWNRAEGRADNRHMDAKLDAQKNLIFEIHKENHAVIQAIREDIKDFHSKWLQESKDFHGRLCAIEEKNKLP